MRQIKFRAWHRGSMTYNHSYSLTLDGCVTYLETYGEWKRDVDKEVILQQFTGLTDKNGKEIYEGDILKYTLRNHNTVATVAPDVERIGQVYWQEFRATWAVKVCEFANQDLFRLIHNVNVSAEVIGNIYDHPHLLNSEPDPTK